MTVLRVNTIAGIGTTTFGPTFGGNLEFNSQNYIVLPKGSSTQQGVLRDIPDVVGTGGTFYDNLVLAMPFNQANGLRDVSSRNRNPGVYGNVSISSTISKYYGSSARFDGSGDYIGFSTTGDFVFGAGNFTIEGWFYLNGTGQQHLFENRGGSNTNTVLVNINSSTQLSVFLNGSYRITGSTLSTATWYHFALVKNGGTTTLYQNGSSLGTYADSNTYVGPQNGNTYIGSDDGPTGSYLNGHIQDLRVYKGIAKYTANFTPPDRIAEVGVGFTTGQLRYNTDSNLPELYDGNQWVQLSVSQVGLGTGGDTEPGARGVFGGGRTPGNVNTIQYINIASTGNAVSFGSLTAARSYNGSNSSSTRGLFNGGISGPTIYSTIDYITISSTGDATSFGSLSLARYGVASCSNSTRGITAGGFILSPAITPVNNIDYVTIASTGNAVSFGTLSTIRNYAGSCASPTRGIFAGGTPVGSPYTPLTNVIEYITISTLGNTSDFGDLTSARSSPTGCSNATRGIFGGGYVSPGVTYINNIEYITISTLGNSVSFGNLSVAKSGLVSCSSSTRGVFGGGYSPSLTNVIEYVSIATQGNSIDFGDLIAPISNLSACSNAHGGL